MAEVTKEAPKALPMPEQKGITSPHFREVAPDYFFGGVKLGFIEMTVLTTRHNAFESVINKKEVVEHVEELTLKFAPLQAKSLIIWLLSNVKAYESNFGQIPSIETDPTKLEIGKKVDDLLAKL
ncbi:MAG: hypothetical protein ACE14P_14090 [Methanotrichaceae archaeon]